MTFKPHSLSSIDAATFGISQFTTWPWAFERDLVEYPRAGAGAIEICEFKLDRNDYAPQLEAVPAAGLRVSSVQTTIHAVFPDSIAPAPFDPKLRVQHITDRWIGSPRTCREHAVRRRHRRCADGRLASSCSPRCWTCCRGWRTMRPGLGMRLAFEPLNPILFHTDTALWGWTRGSTWSNASIIRSSAFAWTPGTSFRRRALSEAIARAGEKIFVVQISDWQAAARECGPAQPGRRHHPVGRHLRCGAASRLYRALRPRDLLRRVAAGFAVARRHRRLVAAQRGSLRGAGARGAVMTASRSR